MLGRLFARIRTSTAIALALALLVAGIASGAAGSYLIIGQANDSGTAQTVLNNAGLGAAFTLRTTNAATGATGIFGYSTSTQTYATKGVYGRADGPNSYGVYGLNTGTAGTGAAIFADGNANPGLVVDVDSNSVDPIKVNSTGMVDNLNADMVDYFHASSLSRMEYAYTENAPDGDGTVLTVNITAPARGWLSITASVDSYSFSASDDFSCQLSQGTSYVGGSLRFVSLVDNANEEQDCSTNGAVSTCGGPEAITFEAANVDAALFAAATMEVTFTPFNGSGNQPSIFGCLIVLSPSPGLKAGMAPEL